MRNASPLGRRAGRSPTTPDEFAALESAVWHKRGGLIVYPDQEREAGNEWLALAVEARGAEKFGPRLKN